MILYFPTGSTPPLSIRMRGSTSSDTVTGKLFRLSDLSWLDWDDSTFKSSGHTSPTTNLTHVGDATDEVWVLKPTGLGDDHYLLLVSFTADGVTVTDDIRFCIGQSIAADITFIKNVEGGRWQITSNQLIIFEDDNSTEVCRFDLKDSAGSPTETNVYDRRRA